MLSHVDKNNNPAMVDVSDKPVTFREATARAHVHLPEELLPYFNESDELNLKKGPVFQTAIISGTMAAKETHRLIPFCHPLLLEKIKITIKRTQENQLQIESQVRCQGKTGVEMEALMAASNAALTIYDMCKAVTKGIVIEKIFLVKKSGGKSDWENENALSSN